MYSNLKSTILFFVFVALTKTVVANECYYEKLYGIYKSKYYKISDYYDATRIAVLGRGSCEQFVAERTDCNGDILWRTYLQMGYGGVNDLIINTEDSSVIIAGYDWEADDYIVPSVAKVFFLNPNGDIYKTYDYQIDTLVTLDEYQSSRGFTVIAAGDSNCLFALLENNIVKIDSNGVILQIEPIAATVKSLTFDALQGNVIVYTDNGISIYDTALNLLDEKFSGTSYAKGIANDSYFYLQSSADIIQKADAQLNILNSVSTGNTIINFEIYNNHVFALLKSATQFYFAVYDNSLTFINSFSVQNSDFTVSDFSISDSVIHATGWLHQHEQIFMYRKSFALNSFPDVAKTFDIGVVNVFYENYSETFQFEVEMPSLSYEVYNIEADVYATVKNFSDTIVSHYHVNSELLGGMNCSDFVFNRYSDVPLLPDDTISIFLGKYRTSISRRAGQNNSISICAFSVAPNFLPDSEPANDKFCGNLLISSVAEKEKVQDFSIFPNPFSDVIYIQHNGTGAKTASVVITDVSGKIIRKENDVNFSENTVKIDNLSGLAASVYFLSVQFADGGKQHFRLIKN